MPSASKLAACAGIATQPMWMPSCGITRSGRLNIGGSWLGRICTSRRLSAAWSSASASLGVVTASASLAIARIEAKKRWAAIPSCPGALAASSSSATR